MIDDVDHKLKEWVGSVIEDAEVVLELPCEPGKTHTVGLYLLDLLNGIPTHRDRPAPLQIELRYLITTWADEPEAAHRLLGRLVFAAMQSPEFEIELEPLAPEIWASFGISPRPAFLIRVPVEMERHITSFPRVRVPTEFRVVPTTSLAGTVVGPGQVPLPEARVELPALNLTTRTDVDGRFRFSAIPPDPKEKEIRVRLKGLEVSTTTAGGAEPLVIQFDPEEV